MGVDLFIVEQLPLLMKIDSRDSGRIVYGRGSVSKFHSICQGYVFTRVWDCWFVSRFTKQKKKLQRRFPENVDVGLVSARTGPD